MFGEYLTQFFECNTKNKLYLACSREVEDNKIKSLENVEVYKGYVQDMIKDENFAAGKQLQAIYQNREFLDPKMLICGNQSAMGKQVFEALTNAKVFGESELEQS